MSKLASLLAAVGLGGMVSCNSQVSPETAAIEKLSAEAGVYAVVANVAHHIDAKRWKELTGLFAAEVRTDYTSLFGGKPTTQSNEALIAGWREALEHVITQHHLGPITVDVKGESASAHCSVRGHHFVEDAPSGSTWMVAGSYDFELARTEGTWRIAKMTLNTSYQTGNSKLLKEAAAAH